MMLASKSELPCLPGSRCGTPEALHCLLFRTTTTTTPLPNIIITIMLLRLRTTSNIMDTTMAQGTTTDHHGTKVTTGIMDTTMDVMVR